MCHGLPGNASFFQGLYRLDEFKAAGAQASGCALCGGPLHVSDYDRKPRGVPLGQEVHFKRRLSFCCGRRDCRKRTTPPSVRFLGRRVYLAAVVVLAAALAGGLTPGRVARLRELVGMDPRTLERWVRWWRETFPETPLWRAQRGRVIPPVRAGDFPRRLLTRFMGAGTDRLRAFLLFLGPATTVTSWPAQRALFDGRLKPAEDAF